MLDALLDATYVASGSRLTHSQSSFTAQRFLTPTADYAFLCVLSTASGGGNAGLLLTIAELRPSHQRSADRPADEA